MGSSTATRFLSLLSTATTPSPLLRRYPSLLRYLPRPLPLRLISSYSSSSQSHTQPISSSWPEWSQLLHSLSSSGYFPSEPEEHPTHPLSIDLSASSPPLPPDFLRVASACFAFSRARSHILWMLPRRDIEVVVQHGLPFLFKGCDESVRRMKLFLAGNEQNGEGAEVAVDLMKYLLSYVSGVSSEGNNVHNAEVVEPSVRNLLHEMCHLSYFNDNSRRSNIEMKRGDWICPRCQFMNFARNVKCLECEEPRPRKQLTGREWECPQCDFLNFGRNVVCLRCDCKRPSDSVHGMTNSGLGFGRGDGNNGSKADADGISATNEEKAQRWFSKLSQLHSSSPGVSSDIVDGNFPEMMPLRKSMNRRGVALEQANNPKYVPFVPFAPGYFARKDDQQQDNKATGETSISEIPRKFTDTAPGVSHNPNAPVTENQQLGTTHEPGSGNSTQNVIDPRHGGSNSQRGQYSSFDTISEMLNPEGDSQRNLSARQRGGPNSDNSGYPGKQNSSFDTTSEMLNPEGDSQQNLSARQRGASDSDSSGYPGKQNSNETGNFSSPQPSVKPSIAANWTGKSLEGSQVKEPDPLDMSEEAKAERWFRRVAQIKDISELSQIPDEDFPSIMPMRKGVNRFVVSKRKTPLERRLTSTQYRRNLPVVSSDPVKENDN